MRLIITRHGETEANVKHLLAGSIQTPLTKNGIRQASKLAERLKDEKIDMIVSSDLMRAYDTAKIISEFHQNAEFLKDKRLREGNLGDFEGRKKDEVDWNFPPENSESRTDMAERIYEVVFELLKEHVEDTILLVGHSGINRALIGKIRGNVERYFDKIGQRNTCLNILDVDSDENFKEVLINCTEHLDED